MYSETTYQVLRQAGHRVTRPRKAVIQVLQEARDWLRPETVLTRARDIYPSLGLVTVYRTLALLADLGCARRIHFEDGCQGYVRRELGHSHHLICRACREAVEFPGLEDLDQLIKPIETRTGFVIEEHMIEMLGLCPNCQQQ
jgi:Fe2+ or Zn2+ uptake regulation protein